MDRTLFANMRDKLARLFSDKKEILRVCKDAGIEAITVALDSTPQNNWGEVLHEAEKLDLVGVILSISYRKGKQDPQFRSIYNEYFSVKLDDFDLKELQHQQHLPNSKSQMTPLDADPESLTHWFFEELQPDEQSLLVTVALFQGMSRHKIMGVALAVEGILS